MKIRGKRYVLAAMLLGIATASCMPAVSAEAASKTTVKKRYAQFLKTKSQYSRFALIYYNNDSTLDLVVSGEGIYTYRKGNIIKLASLPFNHLFDSYVKKKSTCKLTYGHSNVFGTTLVDTYLKQSGTDVKTVLLRTKYTEKKKTTITYENGNFKKIKKSTYNKALKKLGKKWTKVKLKYCSTKNIAALTK